MRKQLAGSLVFLTGLSLGWYLHGEWGDDLVALIQPPIATPSDVIDQQTFVADTTSAPPSAADALAALLVNEQYEAAVEHYESLQEQADETGAGDARSRILSHARQLVSEGNYHQAQELLQGFLIAAYRDVEARVVLAHTHQGQKDIRAAVDQLYQAKGYAYRPAMLQQIDGHIRSMVSNVTQTLKQEQSQDALLSLYQQLTQMEPDHAPYFLELAAAQLALDDIGAAQRSLLLISRDPEVGAQAQTMLAEIDAALRATQEREPPAAETALAGIPLHRDGNHFIVDAQPSPDHNLRLLIDTGASLTILSPEVFEQRGIRYQNTGRTGIFSTANGQVRAPIYRLESLTVGDWQVRQIEIGVLDFSDRSAIDGLLGMNFLNQFQFFIDQNEALLRLSIN